MRKIAMASKAGMAGVLVLAAGMAHAKKPIEVIFTTVPGGPAHQVPGLPAGTGFKTGLQNGQFDRPFLSADGSRWVISALTDLASSEDEVVIVGQGPKRAGAAIVAREGTPTPVDAARTFRTIDQRLDVNNAGRVAFTSNLSTTGPDDEAIWAYNQTAFSLAIREGSAIPAFPGLTHGNNINSANVLESGTLAYQAQLAGAGVTTSNDFANVIGSTSAVREGDTVSGSTILSLDSGDFMTNASGTAWLAKARVPRPNATDAADPSVLIVNGSIVLRASAIDGTTQAVTAPGTIIPGLTTPIANLSIDEVDMAPNGDWYARGNAVDLTEDWAVKNGTLIAKGGDAIAPGSALVWEDGDSQGNAFLTVGGDQDGNYVVSGLTATFDSVLGREIGVAVYNGTRVIAKSGDALDLNDDGVADDAFIDGFVLTAFDSFNPTRAVVGGGYYYFCANVRTAAGTRIGQAFMVVPTCTADVDDGTSTGNTDGGVGIEDLLYYLSLFEAGSTDADVDDGSGTGYTDEGVGIEDLLYYLSAFEGGC